MRSSASSDRCVPGWQRDRLTVPPRQLRESFKVYRVGTAGGAYPVWSGEGAALHPGRWHDLDQRAIYASVAYSTALLEILVRTGDMPASQYRVEASIPPGISYEEVGPESVEGWSEANQLNARAFGKAWYDSGRSCLLIVPSAVTWLDRSVVINAEHPEAARIETGHEILVRWDERLFGG